MMNQILTIKKNFNRLQYTLLGAGSLILAEKIIQSQKDN